MTTATLPKLAFTAASDSHIGMVRQKNQDAVFSWVSPPNGKEPRALLLVADGMGGLKAGQVASWLAIEVVTRAIMPLLEHEPSLVLPALAETLEQAFQDANRTAINLAIHKMGGPGQMGTTLTGVLVLGDQAVVAHVGDSRAYLSNQSGMQQLTVDHSLAGQLIADGCLDPGEVFDYPQRNLLTRGIGLYPGLPIDMKNISVRPGDRLLLCTDGLWGMMRDQQEFERILSQARTPASATRALVTVANSYGGDDNIGLVICEVTD